ncbi:SMI1/KNR4 family protein [Streptomyces sp. NPDC004838]
MTRAFDIEQRLAEAVGGQGRAGAWEFIRGFADAWAEPLEDGDGYSEEELATAEARLGVRLPPALAEAYRLLGRRMDLTSNHDHLLKPSRLYIDDRKEALVFREENQGACVWGVLLSELEKEDPAVVVQADLADETAEEWEGWLDRVSLCFVEIVLAESVHVPEELCDFVDEIEDEGTVERSFARLPLPEYPVGQQSTGTRWFMATDVLLRHDGGVLYARGRTEEALERVRELIRGPWLNEYGDDYEDHDDE